MNSKMCETLRNGRDDMDGRWFTSEKKNDLWAEDITIETPQMKCGGKSNLQNRTEIQ